MRCPKNTVVRTNESRFICIVTRWLGSRPSSCQLYILFEWNCEIYGHAKDLDPAMHLRLRRNIARHDISFHSFILANILSRYTQNVAFGVKHPEMSWNYKSYNYEWNGTCLPFVKYAWSMSTVEGAFPLSVMANYTGRRNQWPWPGNLQLDRIT